MEAVLFAAILHGCGDPGTETETDGSPTDGSDTVDTSTPEPEPLADGLAWSLHPEQQAIVDVTWQQSRDEEVRIEYSVDPGEWRSAPPVAGRAGANGQRIVGIPLGTEASWRVVGATGTVEAPEPIRTGPIPEGLPRPRITAAEPDAWLPGSDFLLTSISETQGGWGTNGPFWVLILDRRGRPVWAVRTDNGAWSLYAQVSVTGDHLMYDEFRWIGGGDPELHRTWLDGEIEVVGIPGFHHALVELPDGTLAWASRSHGGGEALVERAPGQVGETVLWTCADSWPESGGTCHSNCLYYDESSDSYLYSFYSNETVVNIDRASGETLWWAGGIGGGYRFFPAESQFFWQHGVSFTPAGTLLVSTQDPTRTTNLAREYTVDRAAKTLTEIWSYDAETLANTNGDTWRLPNGNTLHTLGSASEVKEVAPDGRVVWDLDFDGTKLMGRSQLLDDLYALLAPTE